VETTALRVNVPVTSFRVPHAREYFETLPCPPPSTIYGMLLSMVGEADRTRHKGAEIASAMLSSPGRSTVLRTLWREKNRNEPRGVGKNRCPDFQQLLSPVEIAVFIRGGAEEAEAPLLSDRVETALKRPETVERFGALSLGESTHLVNDVLRWEDGNRAGGRLLVRDPEGPLCLPVWVDHVGSEGTQFRNYRLEDSCLERPLPDSAWTCITREAPA